MENSTEFAKIVEDFKKLICDSCAQHKKPAMFLHVRSEIEIRQAMKNPEIMEHVKDVLAWVVFDKETL